MAVIKSGASVDELTVDPTAKAARATLYGPDGEVVHNSYLGSYMAPIEIIPTTLAAGTTYWALRNLGANRVFLRQLYLEIGFSGGGAATRSIFEIERFSDATPTGGTALTVLKKDNTYPGSSVTDARFAPGGLATTGLTFEDPFHLLAVSSEGGTTVEDLRLGDRDDEYGRLVLAPNEGLCIRANTAIIADSYIVGSAHWDERV